ncbi:MAG: hypothetical protein CMB72_02575 [Euryarchaeota archaeon]|nr:hypothetical protein [Euryarchaeota archaeon]|tara:strand:+ start:908 stop:1453 length:546 start_codon:yes stop_codon:yes gene_type:complete
MEKLDESSQKLLASFPILLAISSTIFLYHDGLIPTEIGLIPIFAAMSIRLLATEFEIPFNNEIQILLIFFTLTHNLLFSFFTDFNFLLILGIFLGVIILLTIQRNGDTNTISILFGILCGTQSMKLSLIDNGWSLPIPSESLDILYLNWIKFLSAPVLGAIIFISIRILVSSIPETTDESE